MIPKKTISRKTFKPDVGKIIFVSSLFRFKILSLAKDELKPIFLIFAPEKIAFHQTKEERVDDLLKIILEMCYFHHMKRIILLSLNMRKKLFR